MRWFWQQVRTYHFHLLVIGAIRLTAGNEAASRYIDGLGR
jgi:hypothetical protein